MTATVMFLTSIDVLQRIESQFQQQIH